ncbi:hypothetical protein K227x_17190 [Rubripirellula lacrimiformis]|uniref:Uncharacterized protein n=2 Tax=Rubripirellula lacrimiformis TaxID=1930273 RepID=A0A517N872_9BACT|nr:hypothetical protein K227x_17190 [Rubripirellula lacrimiformis]
MARCKTKRGLAIAFLVGGAATLLGITGWHFYRVRLCDRLLGKIDQLASYPPSETSDLIE